MRLLAFIMMSVLFMPMPADAVLVGKNIIANGGFENRPGGKDEDPRGWGSWNSGYNGLATDEFRSGSQSAYLICPKTDDDTGIFFVYPKVKVGKEYRFSCYVKNSSKEPMKGDVFGQLSIEWQKKDKDKDGKDIMTEVGRDLGPKFGPELAVIKWAPFTMTATAPIDADTCRFVVQFSNNGSGSGKFFVEEASAEELDQYFKAKGRDIKTGSRAVVAKSKNITAKELVLPNAGFEEPKGSDSGDPSEWICWNSDYNGIVAGKARTGDQSIYVSSPLEPETHSGIYYHFNGVKPGTEYAFSCHVINSDTDPVTGGAYGQLSIEWQKTGEDKDGNDISIEISRAWGPTFGPDLSTTKWKLEEMTGMAPADADSCNFVIQFFNKDGRGTVYVDDAVAEEK